MRAVRSSYLKATAVGKLLFLLAGLLLLWSPAPAAADIITFDFEDVLPGQPLNPNPTQVNSISQTVSGLTVTITRSSGVDLQVWDLDVFSGPATWGVRSFGPFNDTMGDFFVANFSSPIMSASIEFGDFGADTDDTVILRAFSGLNGTGSLLDEALGSWGTGNIGQGDPPLSLSVSASGIQSLLFQGGSNDFPQSLFWDNLTVETAQVAVIPEPTSLTLFGLGLASLVGGTWWRRSSGRRSQ